jgi:hypothetical protein
MNLHLNKELFDQDVIMASDAMMINPEIIEKQKKTVFSYIMQSFSFHY